MTQQHPSPLVPADVDLRGLEYMPLFGNHLFGSDFNAAATDAEWRAAVTLWWAAWNQVPAGSLPSDEVALCRHADLGRDLKTWRKLKARALHGFVQCSDGRLYHEFVCAQALVAWDKRVKERERKAQWRAARQGRDSSSDGDKPPDKPPLSQPQERGPDADVPADGKRRDVTGRDNELNTADLRSAVHDAANGDAGPHHANGFALVSPEPPGLPDCPHQDLIGLYRKHLPHLRQPARWDGERAESMRTRWRECAQPTQFGDGYATKADGLAFWDKFFAHVAATRKLRDGITSSNGGETRTWKPSLDWLVAKGNFTKVIEGAYA